MAARVNDGGDRQPEGEGWGEGQVTVRDLAGALPSEGCGARQSSPRKALLVSSSNAHSGGVGPGLHSESCDAGGPRGTMCGPRMSAMLNGVRAVRGSGPELMAGWAVVSRHPLPWSPQLPGPRHAAPYLGPRLGPAPRAGLEPRVPLLLRPHLPTRGRGGSGAGRCPCSDISTG